MRFLSLKGEVEDYDYVVFDDSLARNKNRIRIEFEDDDDDLSEPIKWKLFLMRQLTLLQLEKAHS